MTLPCIRCWKELESAIPDEVDDEANQPYAGTAFTTRGHYGSTVFDPMDQWSFLELNICDDCLRAAAKKGHVLLGLKEPAPRSVKYQPWDPEKGP